MSERSRKKVGVKDIAAKAGISIGTVDRVLHNRGDVKEETRRKVMSIIEELEYTPNLLAKSLSSRKITRIAIVIPDSSDNNPYWKKPIEGIKRAADELDHYHTEVKYVFFDASSEKSFEQVLEDVSRWDPDGIVLNPVFKSTSLSYIKALDANNIPYVFIDVNLEEVNNLGYFGQDAEQSGKVAAQLMGKAIPNNSNILIVKQSNKKVFSQHIESRIKGFLQFISQEENDMNFSPKIVEIDLLDENEPGTTLDDIFARSGTFQGIFIPNSRAFKVGDYMLTKDICKPIVVGYDLLDENVRYLNEGFITYLISQKPEIQAYNAIFALFDHLVTRREVNKTNFSPIDIIIRENLKYYLKS